jgi:hypothetical protein
MSAHPFWKTSLNRRAKTAGLISERRAGLFMDLPVVDVEIDRYAR